MELVKIDKGVQPKSVARSGSRRYPWKEMDVGDSFLVTTSSANAHYAMAFAASRDYAPKKFKAGKDTEGNRRIWRIV